MSSPFMNFNLEPSLDVMASCITRLNETYQRLLNQPESLEHCAEAGKSIRLMVLRYSKVLITIVSAQSESEPDNDDEWEDEVGRFAEEE